MEVHCEITVGRAWGCHSCFAATSSVLFTTWASCRADASEHASYTTCKHCGPIVLHPYHQLYAIQTVEVCAFEMTTSTTARLSCTRRTTRSTNDAHQCTCPVLCSQWSLLSQSSLRPVSLPFAHHRSACWASCRFEGLRPLRCSVLCCCALCVATGGAWCLRSTEIQLKKFVKVGRKICMDLFIQSRLSA
jgi:hypothetical protein